VTRVFVAFLVSPGSLYPAVAAPSGQGAKDDAPGLDHLLLGRVGEVELVRRIRRGMTARETLYTLTSMPSFTATAFIFTSSCGFGLPTDEPPGPPCHPERVGLLEPFLCFLIVVGDPQASDLTGSSSTQAVDALIWKAFSCET